MRLSTNIVRVFSAVVSIIFQGRLTRPLTATAGLYAVTRSARRVGGKETGRDERNERRIEGQFSVTRIR